MKESNDIDIMSRVELVTDSAAEQERLAAVCSEIGELRAQRSAAAEVVVPISSSACNLSRIGAGEIPAVVEAASDRPAAAVGGGSHDSVERARR